MKNYVTTWQRHISRLLKSLLLYNFHDLFHKTPSFIYHLQIHATIWPCLATWMPCRAYVRTELRTDPPSPPKRLQRWQMKSSLLNATRSSSDHLCSFYKTRRLQIRRIKGDCWATNFDELSKAVNLIPTFELRRSLSHIEIIRKSSSLNSGPVKTISQRFLRFCGWAWDMELRNADHITSNRAPMATCCIQRIPNCSECTIPRLHTRLDPLKPPWAYFTSFIRTREQSGQWWRHHWNSTGMRRDAHLDIWNYAQAVVSWYPIELHGRGQITNQFWECNHVPQASCPFEKLS